MRRRLNFEGGLEISVWVSNACPTQSAQGGLQGWQKPLSLSDKMGLVVLLVSPVAGAGRRSHDSGGPLSDPRQDTPLAFKMSILAFLASTRNVALGIASSQVQLCSSSHDRFLFRTVHEKVLFPVDGTTTRLWPMKL